MRFQEEIEIMCGFACSVGSSQNTELLGTKFNTIQYRGPDNTIQYQIDDVFMVFHRLAIMDMTKAGNQPFVLDSRPDLVLMCNGEIYNHHILIQKYGFDVESESDCEIIIHMYATFGLQRTIKELDGVFAFVLYDRQQEVLHIGRDPIGVRPCFWGIDKDRALYVASEAKALDTFVERVNPFVPGMSMTWCLEKREIRQSTVIYPYNYLEIGPVTEDFLLDQIRYRLSDAVKKRMMSHREIGCLLSGGLDSSLIAALVSSFSDKPIQTFSIGLKDSVDLHYARMVADHIGSIHHEVELTEDAFLQAIPEVIYNIESYDTTTVRASVGNYLVSKYISENTDCKVIFNGDGSDEVCVGYFYNINAPDLKALQQESVRLVRELHYFDVLRSDRSISSNGLEARTPFLDPQFVNFYMGIPPEHKVFDNEKIEKYLLRKAFDGQNLLPDAVLWRRKCAFSDGVSTQKRSWHHIIQEFVDGKITDEEFELQKETYLHCQPQLKESLFYRQIFESYFQQSAHRLIPHFWLPKWSDVIDPSARELDSYQGS